MDVCIINTRQDNKVVNIAVSIANWEAFCDYTPSFVSKEPLQELLEQSRNQNLEEKINKMHEPPKVQQHERT